MVGVLSIYAIPNLPQPAPVTTLPYGAHCQFLLHVLLVLIWYAFWICQYSKRFYFICIPCLGTSVGTQGCTFCSYATSSETAAVAATSTTRAEATIKETAGFIRPNSINHHITSQLRRYDFLFPFSFRKKKHCCSVCLLNGEEASGQIILSQGLRGSFFLNKKINYLWLCYPLKHQE